MLFDVRKALLEIEARDVTTPATLATQKVNQAEIQPNVAEVAGVAVAEHQSQKTAEIIILDEIRAGNLRHGPIARASGLGCTKGYQEIERLRDVLFEQWVKDFTKPGVFPNITITDQFDLKQFKNGFCVDNAIFFSPTVINDDSRQKQARGRSIAPTLGRFKSCLVAYLVSGKPLKAF